MSDPRPAADLNADRFAEALAPVLPAWREDGEVPDLAPAVVARLRIERRAPESPRRWVHAGWAALAAGLLIAAPLAVMPGKRADMPIVAVTDTVVKDAVVTESSPPAPGSARGGARRGHRVRDGSTRGARPGDRPRSGGADRRRVSAAICCRGELFSRERLVEVWDALPEPDRTWRDEVRDGGAAVPERGADGRLAVRGGPAPAAAAVLIGRRRRDPQAEPDPPARPGPAPASRIGSSYPNGGGRRWFAADETGAAGSRRGRTDSASLAPNDRLNARHALRPDPVQAPLRTRQPAGGRRTPLPRPPAGARRGHAPRRWSVAPSNAASRSTRPPANATTAATRSTSCGRWTNTSGSPAVSSPPGARCWRWSGRSVMSG